VVYGHYQPSGDHRGETLSHYVQVIPLEKEEKKENKDKGNKDFPTLLAENLAEKLPSFIQLKNGEYIFSWISK
jgi:hypothetical protein